MGNKQACIPAKLGKLRERFDRWRRTHAVRSRLPDELWVAAAKMASIYGLNRTVKTLRLDYYALKKRVESSPKKRGKRRVASTADRSKSGVLKSVDLQKSGGVRFVELANSLQTGGCECCVEWEDAAGAKMRVHLKGSAAQAGLAMPDLAALSRSFWEDPTS